MRFLYFVIGLANAFLFSFNMFDILNGNISKTVIVLTMFEGILGIACFAAIFGSILNDYYTEDDE